MTQVYDQTTFDTLFSYEYTRERKYNLFTFLQALYYDRLVTHKSTSLPMAYSTDILCMCYEVIIIFTSVRGGNGGSMWILNKETKRFTLFFHKKKNIYICKLTMFLETLTTMCLTRKLLLVASSYTQEPNNFIFSIFIYNALT